MELFSKNVLARTAILFCLLAITTFFSACAGTRILNEVYTNQAKGFAVHLPPEEWRIDRGEEADLVLRHKDRQAGILINAACGETPPDRPLTILSRHLFLGIRGKEILRVGHRTLGQDETLEVVLRGTMGTTDLLLHGYTMKRPGCVYDLVLFASPQDYSEVNGQFDAVASQFRLLKREWP